MIWRTFVIITLCVAVSVVIADAGLKTVLWAAQQ